METFEDSLNKLEVKLKRIAKNNGRRLDPAAKFYVYALLDPRKAGPWKVRLQDKTITFAYQPFYIGKGKGDRMFSHVKAALSGSAEKSHKKHRILSIIQSGEEVITQQLTPLSDEAEALAKEIMLISSIGREDTGKGPLTNHTNGGEGATGVRWTNRARKHRGLRSKEYWDNLSDKERENHKARIREGRLNMSETKKELERERRSLIRKQQELNMTAKERKLRADKAREKTKLQMAEETANARKRRVRKWKETMERKPAEELASINIRRGEGIRKAWAQKTPAELRALGQKKSEALSRLYAEPGTLARINAKRERTRRENLARLTEKERLALKAKRSERMRQAKADQSPERKREISEQRRNKPKVKCPYCGKTGTAGGNMTRYHFDNCKVK